MICSTGASGAVYFKRTVEALTGLGHEVHAVMSAWGTKVFAEEIGIKPADWLAGLSPKPRSWDQADMAAAPSSGSWRLDGTAVVPCSMASLGAIASGAASNLVHRAALVALKEGRPLALVPREAPLSLIDLRNLVSVAEAGAAVLPASPAFYHKPRGVDGLVDFVVGKLLDRLGVEHGLFERWGSESSPGD